VPARDHAIVQHEVAIGAAADGDDVLAEGVRRERAVAADVHGILMRVASLEDTLRGKIKAWSEPRRRQSKRIKDLADIARLIESHPRLWDSLPDNLQAQIEKPKL
jgi:hypothetical protein